MKKQLSTWLLLLLITIINFGASAQPFEDDGTVTVRVCDVEAQETYVIQGLNNNLFFGSGPLLGENTQVTVATFELTLQSGPKVYLAALPAAGGVFQAEFKVLCSNKVVSATFHANAVNTESGNACYDTKSNYQGGDCGTTDGDGKPPANKLPKIPKLNLGDKG